MDAFEAGIPESLVDLDQQIAGPGESVADYRHRIERMRRELTRQRVTQLVGEIDELVARIRARNPQEAGKVDGDPEWPTLGDAASQLRRLTSPQSPGGSWNTLFRHLSFAEAVDLRDIVERDWPEVRAAVSAGFYAEDEPLPVEGRPRRPSGPAALGVSEHGAGLGPASA